MRHLDEDTEGDKRVPSIYDNIPGSRSFLLKLFSFFVPFPFLIVFHNNVYKIIV